MIDCLELGPVPKEEKCVLVDKDKNYLPAMRKECERFMSLLEKAYPSARFRIDRVMHDAGEYLDVVVVFNNEDFEETDYAVYIQDNLPDTWAELEAATPIYCHRNEYEEYYEKTEKP